MRSYILSAAAGMVLMAGALAAAFTAAAAIWPDRMPPPAISGSIATDEKLKYLRDRGREPVDVLAIGSSITWKHLDGAPFDGRVGNFVNGGTAYLQVHEIRTFTRFYLDLYPRISQVVMLSALPDYGTCAGEGRIMDLEDAASYVRGRMPEAWFYMRYFAPLRYVLQARRRSERLKPYDAFGYWLDRHGTTPSMLPTEVGYDLRYDEIALDPACLEALDGLNRDLTARGVTFTLVMTPVAPRYSDLHPATTRATERIESFARSRGIRLIDFFGDPSFEDADFWDAFHMQWPAARRLSREVADTLL
ncbi:hypothetical protein SAMN05421763_11024 [[Luteovulum] sphaeroides subsp. megalophilum]|uniref:hypothetical protein n=1 Tax=Cereibacter sphaeroides TaxID=1063 RepID=UPI000B63D0D3|nr:hypothetical protein [Cereibacter sphaeroides]SNT31970.1 hypothetical protein SAMN05421763_11024 [[Luteovulum] sphaeroides subsp. megalophilum]